MRVYLVHGVLPRKISASVFSSQWPLLLDYLPHAELSVDQLVIVDL